MLAKTNWIKGKTVVEPPATAPTNRKNNKNERATPTPSNPQEDDQSEKESPTNPQGGSNYDADKQDTITNSSQKGGSRRSGKKRGANRDNKKLPANANRGNERTHKFRAFNSSKIMDENKPSRGNDMHF